jgi:hypothetical protein
MKPILSGWLHFRAISLSPAAAAVGVPVRSAPQWFSACGYLPGCVADSFHGEVLAQSGRMRTLIHGGPTSGVRSVERDVFFSKERDDAGIAVLSAAFL